MASSAALSIECSDQPLDLSFHPSRSSLVAVGLVDGTVEVHDFGVGEMAAAAVASSTGGQQQAPSAADDDDDDEEDDDTIVSSTAVHTQWIAGRSRSRDGGDGGATATTTANSTHCKHASCRTVRYSADGRALWTGGSGGDLACLDAERVGTFSSSNNNSSKNHHQSIVTARVERASSCGGQSPIQVLHELPPDRGHGLLVAGDEAGGVRVWDPRILGSGSSSSSNSNTPVAAWKVHQDYVSGLEDDGHHTLLAASADGTLSVYDLRMARKSSVEATQTQQNRGLIRQSDHQEDELLSIKLMKNGRKVVCGTGDGVLSVFSFGTWGDVSDRFPGHPRSVDALVKVDEDTLLTGSSDGLIRVVSVHPDRFLGVLGDNHEGFPIEKLQFNADRSYLGSVTHDNYVRLWDASVLKDDDDDEDEDEDREGDVKMSADMPSAAAAAASNNNHSDDDWDDMDGEMEEDSDDKDSDSDDSDDNRKPSKNDKRASRFKSERERFFDDL